MENEKGNDLNGEMLKNAGDGGWHLQANDNYFASKETPAGYRFCPTDEELIVEYLANKIVNVDLARRRYPIREVNIYNYTPMELAEMYKLEKETELYFFTPRFKKYPNGSRPDRDAGGGHWKPTAAAEAVFNQHKQRVGSKRTLAFYEGINRDNKNKKKTDWLMHEYKLEEKSGKSTPRRNHKQLDDCVLVRIYKKRGKANNGGKTESAVDEIGLHFDSVDAQPHYYQTHTPSASVLLPGFSEVRNQAPFVPPARSPILSMPPLLELPSLPEKHFFNDMGLYYTPNHASCSAFDPQHNQMNQPSGPPPQPFGLSGAPQLESTYNIRQVNPVNQNDMQLKQIGGAHKAQLGECSNYTFLGGWQSGDLGLRNDPSFRMVIDEDYTHVMDLLLDDEVTPEPQPPKAFLPLQ